MVNECGPSANHGKDGTYGIATDPLTQFACIMAALLHDSDHEGVPSKFCVLVYNHASIMLALMTVFRFILQQTPN